jgi:3-phenylpropionate/cinnamic acid dioxygenase small subunit
VTTDAPGTGRRLHPGDPTYGEVVSWLYDEAALLDAHRFDEWLELLADDVVYRAPVRVTRAVGQGDGVSSGLSHFDETRASLETRVARLKETAAWAENPPSRTRHLVTNVRVWQLDRGYEVRSGLLLLRSRGGSPAYELLSGERHDRLRRAAHDLVLEHREIVLDQASLGTTNLSTFL